MEPSTSSRAIAPDASLWATNGVATGTASGSARSRLQPAVAARMLAVATGIGILAQLLLVGQSPGINIVLLVAALLAGARLVRAGDARLDPLDRWLPPAALTFAALVAVRSSPYLVAFDLAAALALSGAAVAALMGIVVTRRAASGVIVLGLLFSVGAVAGVVALVPGFGLLRRRSAATRASAVWPFVRGTLIALPIVGLFGSLFASADIVFARTLGDALALRLDLDDLFVRFAVVGMVAWAVGGLFATAAEPRTNEDRTGQAAAEDGGRRVRVGAVESSIVVVAVDVVFALFIVLQAPYLFGGQDTLALTGVSYSDYARRGFFELVGAAFLAGILVMGLDATQDRRSRVFTAGAVALTLLAGVVLMSAAVRLDLYQQAYGWTELRFFVLAAIVWVGACLAAAEFLIARERTRWLPHAGVLLGLLVAFGVNVTDPAAFVAAQNVDRALHPERIAPGGWSGLDIDYLATLGDDAVPTLAAALPALRGTQEGRFLEDALQDRLRDLEAAARLEGWPSTNLSRARALDALRATFGPGTARSQG